MTYDYQKPLDTELIKQLRSIASNAESSSDIRFYLAPRVQDEDTITNYLLCAFGDESIMWHIARRWWKGEHPGRNADNVLRYALKETEHVWKQQAEQ